MNLQESLKQYKEYGVYKLNPKTLEYIINELLKKIEDLETQIVDLEDIIREDNEEPKYDRNDLD